MTVIDLIKPFSQNEEFYAKIVLKTITFTPKRDICATT